MNFSEISNIKWVLPSALAAAWGLRLTMNSELLWIIESIIGMTVIGILVGVYMKDRNDTETVWDESRGILGALYSKTIDVSSARLFDSVPQGIDLSHNSAKVLGAMNVRFEDEPGCTLDFVVCRPLKQGPTRVGFLVKRNGIRIPDSHKKLESLSEVIVSDAQILESAMRAAYPHTPIRTAELQDLLLIQTGGVDTIDRTS